MADNVPGDNELLREILAVLKRIEPQMKRMADAANYEADQVATMRRRTADRRG